MWSSRRLTYSVFLLFLCHGTLCGNNETYCTKRRTYNKATKKYVDQKTYCTYGCCGSSPRQYCCAVSVGAAVGGVAGAVGVLCLVVVVVCCCVKKMNQDNGSVRPDSPDDGNDREFHHQHPSNINVVYAGAIGQYPGLAWSRPRRIHPVKPPPYRATATPPPPYSVSNPVFHFMPITSLPGCSGSASVHSNTASLPGQGVHPGSDSSSYSDSEVVGIIPQAAGTDVSSLEPPNAVSAPAVCDDSLSRYPPHPPLGQNTRHFDGHQPTCTSPIPGSVSSSVDYPREQCLPGTSATGMMDTTCGPHNRSHTDFQYCPTTLRFSESVEYETVPEVGC